MSTGTWIGVDERHYNNSTFKTNMNICIKKTKKSKKYYIVTEEKYNNKQ